MVFRTKLGKLRCRRKLSIREVSDRTGVSVATIWRAEKGVSISLHHAFVLAFFYKLPVSRIWFLRLEGRRNAEKKRGRETA